MSTDPMRRENPPRRQVVTTNMIEPERLHEEDGTTKFETRATGCVQAFAETLDAAQLGKCIVESYKVRWVAAISWYILKHMGMRKTPAVCIGHQGWVFQGTL